MGCIPSLRVLITMTTMCLGVFGKFYRESVHQATDLIGHDVTVNVMSEIPGNLKWVSTTKGYMTVTVKVSATTFDVLNATDILFISDNSSVLLDIRTSSVQEPAAVYSTGSRHDRFLGSTNGVIVLLLWAAVVILDWRCVHAVMLVLIFQTFVGASLDTSDLPHSVDITIEAPSHFRYKSINLMVNNGTLRVTDELFKHAPPEVPSSIFKQAPEVQHSTFKHAQDVHCVTEQSTKGCTNCCYGNGVCFNNTCWCDDSYDSNTECETLKQRDILFVNSLDPRLSKTILPSGKVLDLSPASNSKYKTLRDKGHSQFKLRVRADDSELRDAVLHFDERGFLKRVRYDRSSFTIRRKKDTHCHVNILMKKGGFRHRDMTVNLCNTSNYDNTTDASEHVLDDEAWTLHDNTPNTHRVNKRLKDRKYVHTIPVKFRRCGYDTQHDVSIYFKVNEDISTQNYPHHHTDDIFLHTKYTRNSHQLKIPARNVSDKEIERKCERSTEVRTYLCRAEYLTFYRLLCDSISADSAINETGRNKVTNTHDEAVTICNFLAGTLDDYCSFIMSNDRHLPGNSSCLSRYTETVDLFATNQLTLSPMVILPNGDTVTNKDIVVQIGNLSNTTSMNEIVLTEDVPEFKVLNIAVIPKDPVPQDIYKVRLDYACATNETVIKMNVTGSDKYSSHVTCHGITECNCCNVHAAGAADAVIDYVTISIKDELANTDIYREMVVIF